MKFEKVKYTCQYEGPVKTNEWISIDVILEGEETPEMGLDAAKQKIEGWHSSSGSQSIQVNTGIAATRGRNPADAMVEDINSCTDVKALGTYKLLVKGNEYLQAVYEKKLAELKK